jgi:putative membrane protein
MNADKTSLLTEDPRIPLAAERTFLAWIRTGLALMGFGFVVSRFGLFLRELAAVQKMPQPASHGISLWLGLG